MKLAAIFVPAIVYAAVCVAGEIPNGDFSEGTKGWQLTLQGTVKATMEGVTDAFDGKPALKVSVSEAPESSWWMLRMTSEPGIKLEEGATYTFAFYARCEPGSRSVEVGFSGDGKKLSHRSKFKIIEDWQEFLFSFTATGSSDAARVVFDHLALADKVYYFADFRLAKE